MTELYSLMFLHGLDAADALARAKDKLRAAGHPFRDWAGWQMCGGR